MLLPSHSPALIARGEYLAKLGDCAACHSVPGRPAFAGGLRMAIPIGAIYTTNITPDPVIWHRAVQSRRFRSGAALWRRRRTFALSGNAVSLLREHKA